MFRIKKKKKSKSTIEWVKISRKNEFIIERVKSLCGWSQYYKKGHLSSTHGIFIRFNSGHQPWLQIKIDCLHFVTFLTFSCASCLPSIDETHIWHNRIGRDEVVWKVHTIWLFATEQRAYSSMHELPWIWSLKHNGSWRIKNKQKFWKKFVNKTQILMGTIVSANFQIKTKQNTIGKRLEKNILKNRERNNYNCKLYC